MNPRHVARYGMGPAQGIAAGKLAPPGLEPVEWTLQLLKQDSRRATKQVAKWKAELDRIIQNAPDRRPPSPQQRRVLDVVYRYFRGMGEPCSMRFIAERLRLHHSTVEEHVAGLRRKGWIIPPTARRGFGSYPIPALA